MRTNMRVRRKLRGASEVTNLIEFITRLIHRQAFNLNRDIRTDTKKILGARVCVLRLYLRGRGDGGRRETEGKQTQCVHYKNKDCISSFRQTEKQTELFHCR